MNGFMDSQVRNMLLMLDSFVAGCEMAAKKDDGRIGKDESRELKMIRDATEKYKSTLRVLQRSFDAPDE